MSGSSVIPGPGGGGRGNCHVWFIHSIGMCHYEAYFRFSRSLVCGSFSDIFPPKIPKVPPPSPGP